jgi:hypothetical protein
MPSDLEVIYDALSRWVKRIDGIDAVGVGFGPDLMIIRVTYGGMKDEFEISKELIKNMDSPLTMETQIFERFERNFRLWEVKEE